MNYIGRERERESEGEDGEVRQCWQDEAVRPLGSARFLPLGLSDFLFPVILAAELSIACVYTGRWVVGWGERG